MKKRLISMLLALLVAMGLLPTAAFAASTPEDALGEVHIYNGEVEMSYLSINGRIRSQIYTYYSYDNGSGSTREIPAYCVNPNTVGVPQTVGVGESIEYLADEKASDPKVVGIVANGYPTRSLTELGLENKYQGYYATKMALWCYLISDWDINNLKVNPTLTGVELQRAQKILAAAKDIYARGTAWNEMLSPEVSCTPDRDTAYEVTIDGKQYKQQVFTFWSKTWVCDYAVNVSFSDPSLVPEGTRIVDMNNQDITTITTKGTGDGYAGKFKVLYPLESVQGETGSVQLSFSTNVYKYAVFFAICQEKDEYGELQNYVVDTDPTTTMRLSAYSNYSDGTTIEYETGLRILKYETGTEIPISGALFEVIGPDGDSIGTFVTNGDGRIEIPLSKVGNYTVIERQAPSHYIISEEPAQNVTVVYDEVAEVTFFNDPYGTLRIEKKSDTGMNLPGAVIKIEHIESGQTWTATTTSAGVAIFDQIPLGAYRIQEITAPAGWKLDDTVYTATVVAGETTTIPIINEELPGLRIIKYDRKNMVAMPNVTFAVYRDGKFLGNFKTDQFGEILLTNVEPGTYRAFEVDTGDEGHILDTTPQEVELHAGDGIKELLFFNDVKPGDYFYDAVNWAVEKGITTGTSATTFSPNASCTRAQIVTFLWRASGSPEPKTASNPFTDVAANAYYCKAVLWAVENGITTGTSATTFSPDAPCTRAQGVTFLWRANGSKAASAAASFTDVASDAYYAPAVAWAAEQNVTSGVGNGLFSSDTTCTRAQIVSMLYRLR